jgi:hypothetical protein
VVTRRSACSLAEGLPAEPGARGQRRPRFPFTAQLRHQSVAFAKEGLLLTMKLLELTRQGLQSLETDRFRFASSAQPRRGLTDSHGGGVCGSTRSAFIQVSIDRRERSLRVDTTRRGQSERGSLRSVGPARPCVGPAHIGIGAQLLRASICRSLLRFATLGHATRLTRDASVFNALRDITFGCLRALHCSVDDGSMGEVG